MLGLWNACPAGSTADERRESLMRPGIGTLQPKLQAEERGFTSEKSKARPRALREPFWKARPTPHIGKDQEAAIDLLVWWHNFTHEQARTVLGQWRTMVRNRLSFTDYLRTADAAEVAVYRTLLEIDHDLHPSGSHLAAWLAQVTTENLQQERRKRLATAVRDWLRALQDETPTAKRIFEIRKRVKVHAAALRSLHEAEIALLAEVLCENRIPAKAGRSNDDPYSRTSFKALDRFPEDAREAAYLPMIRIVKLLAAKDSPPRTFLVPIGSADRKALEALLQTLLVSKDVPIIQSRFPEITDGPFWAAVLALDKLNREECVRFVADCITRHVDLAANGSSFRQKSIALANVELLLDRSGNSRKQADVLQEIAAKSGQPKAKAGSVGRLLRRAGILPSKRKKS